VSALYWLNGSEDFLREQVLRKLRQLVLEPGFEEFNHQVVRLSAATKTSVLLDALSELPMMTERRLLELQQAHELNAKVADELARFLQEKLHPGLVVAVVSDPPKTKSGLWDHLRQRGLMLACDLDASQRGDFVAYCCQQKGLQLSKNQQQRVLERSAGGLRLMTSAVERLALFAGESRQVSDAELDRLVHDSAEVQTWKLTAAIGQRKTQEAYALLHKLMQHEEPAQSLLSYLNSYLLGLVQVAELKPRLKTAAAIARELPRRSEFQIRKSLEELSTWSETDLANAFERLARADFRIKTGADPVLVMQLLILQLCHRQAGRR
jgi:DNA polymerase-3 subunit delta